MFQKLKAKAHDQMNARTGGHKELGKAIAETKDVIDAERGIVKKSSTANTSLTTYVSTEDQAFAPIMQQWQTKVAAIDQARDAYLVQLESYNNGFRDILEKQKGLDKVQGNFDKAAKNLSKAQEKLKNNKAPEKQSAIETEVRAAEAEKDAQTKAYEGAAAESREFTIQKIKESLSAYVEAQVAYHNKALELARELEELKAQLNEVTVSEVSHAPIASAHDDE